MTWSAVLLVEAVDSVGLDFPDNSLAAPGSEGPWVVGSAGRCYPGNMLRWSELEVGRLLVPGWTLDEVVVGTFKKREGVNALL